MPDHHLCVVGSLGALPASLPRSLAAWPPAADIHRAAALDDPEAGSHFSFQPWTDLAEEDAGDVGEYEEGEEDAAQQRVGATPQQPQPSQEPPAVLPGCVADDAPAEPTARRSEAARWAAYVPFWTLAAHGTCPAVHWLGWT